MLNPKFCPDFSWIFAHFCRVCFVVKNIPLLEGCLHNNLFRKFFCTNPKGPKLQTLCPVGCCSGATLGLEEGLGNFLGL